MVTSRILIDRILLNGAAVDMHDDALLTTAAQEFLHWAVNVAFLVPGEFPASLDNFGKVSYYAAQVDNGGHRQFAQNSGWDQDDIEPVTVGLEEIGATGFSAIYAEFRRLMDSDHELRSAVLNQKFGRPPEAVRDLDKNFYKIGGFEKLVELKAAWLRSLPNLALLSPEELHKERAAVVARNTALEARRAERIAAREAAEAADPIYVAACRLCALHGVTFSRLTAGSFSKEPDTMSWGIATTDGVVYFMVIGPQQAELQEHGTGKVLATVPVGTKSTPEALRNAMT